MNKKDKLIVAVTGGIASGKSTALKVIKGLGIKTIDSDALSHKLITKSSVKCKIKQHFGKNVFTKGKVDRKKLAVIVFKDPSKLKTLEKILHPEIVSVLKSKIKDFKKRGRGIFVADVPLLFEKKLDKDYDLVLVAASNKKTQYARLKKRGLSKEEILFRLKAQMPTKIKIKKADITVVNNGSLKIYRKTIKNIFKGLTKGYKKV